MPAQSTLRTLSLALAFAIPCAQATVVVPYLSYIGPGPLGVPNEFVRTPVNESGPMTMYQDRIGIHLTIGTPPQHVFVPPHFFDSETYVKSASLCNNYTSTMGLGSAAQECESNYSGVFAANESSTFESSTGSFGTDTVTVFDAVPDLENDTFRFGVLNTNELNYVGEEWGTLGLGPNSTFFKTFFPGKEQVGIYYTGGNSTHGQPAHSMPPRPLVVCELEFDGYNQSHYTGEKFTQPIGTPLANSTNPFTLNVTSIKVGNQEILGGESYLTAVDLSGRVSNVLPASVFDAYVDATGARIRSGLPSYNFSSLPTNPSEWYNFTVTFSNGFTVSLPQNIIINPMQTFEPDLAIASILNVEDPRVSGRWPFPVLSLNQLMFTSYIGIDYAAEEWWLAKAVHPWDEPAANTSPNTNNNTTEPPTGAAAGGIGENVRKVVISVAALAGAFVLFC
ncbi:hypothetical protein TWF730_001445 [Orbilia blumenaviensis]|uniref:Peptidase A1 domain-containing protein n=1 Tax=Orbilia blumenaviensis TaxID=1796055 RepID=A0AAV9UIL3_9PEZI